MLSVISGLIFLTVFLAIYGGYLYVNRERVAVNTRMREIVHTIRRKHELDEELNKPFFDRIIRPVVERLAVGISKNTPAKKKVGLQKKLMMAGNPLNLSPSEFVVVQYGFSIGLPCATLLLALPLGGDTALIIIAMSISIAGGFLLPEYYLIVSSAKRRENIQNDLPDVLDLLTVSVEAGLGFDAALVKVVEKAKGVLAHEFSRVLQEIRMGKPRRDALRDLGVRTGVDDLIAFVGAVIQADQLGVSIGNVLRVQSEQMRQKRRQRAEEKAMKAPVKMLIPLVLFIFPTIFIVALGPAALQILEIF